MFSFSGTDVNGSKRLSPIPGVSHLSLKPSRYLSTVRRTSNQGSVDGFRRKSLQRLATFDSLSVQRRLEARKQMESRTIVLPSPNLEATGAVGANYDRFPLVDPSGRFA